MLVPLTQHSDLAISILLEMRVKMGWVDTATSEVSILLLETNIERLQRKEKSLTL